MQTPENYLKNLPPISTRAVRLRDLTWVSLKQQKRKDETPLPPILNDRPLIVRKALSEASKLNVVPKYLWADQLLAGSYAFPEPSLMLTGATPDYATEDEIRQTADTGFSPASIFGHIAPDYPRLLRMGVSGMIDEIKTRRLTAESEQKRNFYDAAEISLNGLLDFVGQYAALCRNEALTCGDANRKNELLRMAANLEACPLNPPETFHQAVQAVWITHLAFQLTGNNLSLGRGDQYLYPFLNRDLQNGVITLDEAQELCDMLFLKFNERTLDNEIARVLNDWDSIQRRYDEVWENRTIFDRNQQKFNVRDNIDGTNHWLQNLLLGGIRPDGYDGCNLLTAMMLESFDRMRMTHPTLNVRVGKNTPDWCVNKISEVLKNGGGAPCIYNEDALIEAMNKMDIAPEDVRDFANDGCWEVLIPGRTDFYFFRFNLIKAMERVLNHGRSWIDGKQEVPDPGDIGGYSFDELITAVDAQIKAMLDGMALRMREFFMTRHKIAPMPLLSAMLDGPVESGTDMTAGGAKYVLCGFIGEGFSHLMDSLTAIREVVFKRREVTLKRLIEAMNENFENDEPLRQMLESCPRYGTGDERADSTARDFIERYSKMVESINGASERIQYMAGIGTFGWFIASGEATGPTADGRLSGEPLASNTTPTSSAMTNGVTGGIRSYAGIVPSKIPSGGPLDLALSGKYVEGEAGTKRLAGLIKSFVVLGGCMMTITVGDVEVFKKAQLEPEKYRDLRVRMGGWSAYFTMLSKPQQQHHIEKAEAGIL